MRIIGNLRLYKVFLIDLKVCIIYEISEEENIKWFNYVMGNYEDWGEENFGEENVKRGSYCYKRIILAEENVSRRNWQESQMLGEENLRIWGKYQERKITKEDTY